MQKYNKYKKQYQKDQQTILSINYIEEVYKIIYLIKMNMKLSVIFLFNNLRKEKWIFFINMSIKIKLNFFCNKLILNLDPKC